MKKNLGVEVGTVRAELVQAEKMEAENVELGGTGSPSQKIMVNAETNAEKGTYAQAATQTQTEVEKGKGKKKGSNTSAAKPEVSEVSRGAAGHL